MGEEPGSRLSHRLAMPVSGDTLLRLIRGARWEQPEAPRVIGIDEWAYKRGQSYGTTFCDLEKGRVLDLLPDREAGTVSAWLKRHLDVAVIARDRATVVAQAMQDGVPQGKQTADRWHLLHNPGDALRAAVGRHCRAVAAAGVIERSKLERPGLHRMSVCHPGVDALRSERRQARAESYAALSRLHVEGLPPREIARKVGMGQRAIERWLAAGGEPEHRRPPVPSVVDPFRPYLDRRWREGCRNTRQLLREIVADGCKRSSRRSPAGPPLFGVPGRSMGPNLTRCCEPRPAHRGGGALGCSGASATSRRRRATAGGKRTTTGEGASDAVAAEAREIVRRAVGDAAGLTIKAKVRQAARNLGYPVED